MPFNGTGTFTRLFSWTNDKNNGINITASRFDGEDNDFATGLSTCITKDGQQTTTARIGFAQGISYPAGSASGAGLAVAGDITTGIYQASSGTVDIAASGARVGGFNSNGLDNTVIGAGTPLAGSFTNVTASGTATVGSTLAVTSTITGSSTVTGIGFIPTGSATTGDRLFLSSANNPGIAANGSPVAIFTGVSTGVDYFSFTNAATGSPAAILMQAAGSDTNVILNIEGKGTGWTQITPAASGTKGLVIKGMSGQTANLQEWQDNSNTVLASISAAGVATFASPVFTGSPVAPTQSAGDNSTKVATTAYVDQRTALSVGSYALATNNSGGTINANSTTAAANIAIATSGGSATGDTITGTWKAMQKLTNGQTGLWIRSA